MDKTVIEKNNMRILIGLTALLFVQEEVISSVEIYTADNVLVIVIANADCFT